MEEYLNTLNTDKAIALIGLIATILSLGYAYFHNKKNNLKKEIKLSRGHTFSVIKNNPSFRTDELKLLWNDKPVGNVFLLEIYLKNSGIFSLKNEDFLRKTIIAFNEKIEILKTKVFSSSEYTKLVWNKKKNEIDIDIDLLESKKLIKIEIIYTNEKVSPVNIDIAILDGNIEKIELKSTDYSISDRDKDLETADFSVYYYNVFKYLFGSFILIIAITLLIYILNNSTSIFIIIPIVVPIFIFAFYKVRINYGEWIESKGIKEWIEFDCNKNVHKK